MKIIITGAAGFLGREVVLSAVRRGFDVIALFHEKEIFLPPGVRRVKADLTDVPALQSFILQEFPDAVVNCAAVSSVAEAERDPARAELLNAALPRALAMLANHISCRLAHVSTDMVFDGEKGAYEHTDMPFPRNTYAQTKLLGERETLKFGRANAVVVRTTLLSGNSPEGGKSLHERLFAAWARGEKTPLFEEEIRQPVSASNLADALVELCERPNLSGVYHWAGRDALSRFEIGERIARRFGLSPEKWIERSNYEKAGNAAKTRPRDLSLSLTPLAGKLKTRAQSFDEILSEMSVPAGLERWFEEQTGEKVSRRLVKGVDF